jgi:hypothetical protein
LPFIAIGKINGKEKIDTTRLKNSPTKKKAIDRSPHITQSANFTVINHKIPSKLSSKINPKGALNERQKNENKSFTKHSQNICEVKVKEPIIQTIVPSKVYGSGFEK